MFSPKSKSATDFKTTAFNTEYLEGGFGWDYQEERWYSIVFRQKITKQEYFNPQTKELELKQIRQSDILRNRHKISNDMVFMLKGCLGALFSYEIYCNGKLHKSEGEKIQVRINCQKIEYNSYEIEITATKEAWLSARKLVKIVQQEQNRNNKGKQKKPQLSFAA